MSSTLRCLRVLELLADDPFELSFTDLATRLEIPKASAHRLCTTLLEANLITQEPVSRRYMLDSHALWVGSGYLRHSPIYRAAFSRCRNLLARSPGRCNLGCWTGNMCCSFILWVTPVRRTHLRMSVFAGL
jgi:DNA-binding IclR family transcriptional regulator